MSKNREHLADLFKVLNEFEEVEQFVHIVDRRHPRLLIRLRGGEKHTHFFPLTPSDHRSAKNNIHQLRKNLKARLGK